MRATVSIVVGLFLLALPTSCKVAQSERDEQFRYHFSHNGCDTGAQSFDQRSDYCRALLDEQRNRGCARSGRIDLYASQCGEPPAS